MIVSFKMRLQNQNRKTYKTNYVNYEFISFFKDTGMYLRKSFKSNQTLMRALRC